MFDINASVAVFVESDADCVRFGAGMDSSAPDEEVSLEGEWPELGHGPCSTYNLRLWKKRTPEQYAARNKMLLDAVQKQDSPENIFKSVQILFGTWEEEDFYEPMRQRFPEEFVCWEDYMTSSIRQEVIESMKRAAASTQVVLDGHRTSSASAESGRHASASVQQHPEANAATDEAMRHLDILRSHGWIKKRTMKRQIAASDRSAGN